MISLAECFSPEAHHRDRNVVMNTKMYNTKTASCIKTIAWPRALVGEKEDPAVVATPKLK